jgi:CRP-like cAMP-binding protein
MSLLTGEPRSATLCAATEAVAFEITRDDLRDLFAQRPEVVKEIAKVVARRQAERSEALDRATADELRAETASLSERIFERISRFFGGANGRSA